MAVDDTKVNYYDGWDIDQLLSTNTVSVGAGDSAIATIPGNVAIPVFEVQLQIAGKWYQAGTSATANTVATEFTFYTYLQGPTVHIVTTTAGTARYFIWADKINY